MSRQSFLLTGDKFWVAEMVEGHVQDDFVVAVWLFCRTVSEYVAVSG